MADVDGVIDVRTEPWRLKVGEEVYEFHPERNAEDFMKSFRKLQRVRVEARRLQTDFDKEVESEEEVDAVVDKAVERVQKLTAANREYLASMMLKESAERFLANPQGDATVAKMSRWAMEQYGGAARPTGPSNDSSAGLNRTGSRSTARSRSMASTSQDGTSGG